MNPEQTPPAMPDEGVAHYCHLKNREDYSGEHREWTERIICPNHFALAREASPGREGVLREALIREAAEWSFDLSAAPEGEQVLVYRHDGAPAPWGYGVRAISMREDGEWFDDTGDPMTPPVAWTKLADRPLPPGTAEALAANPLPEAPRRDDGATV